MGRCRRTVQCASGIGCKAACVTVSSSGFLASVGAEEVSHVMAYVCDWHAGLGKGLKEAKGPPGDMKIPTPLSSLERNVYLVLIS